MFFLRLELILMYFLLWLFYSQSAAPPQQKGVAVLFLGSNKGFYTFTIWESKQGN